MDLQRFSAQERTEQATPKRREEARKKGQVARSMEANAALTLLAALVALKVAAPWLSGQLRTFSGGLWGRASDQPFDIASIHGLITQVALFVATLVLPIAGAVALVGVGANLLQVGFLFTGEPLRPKFDRLNPAQGLKRLFSRHSLMELGKALFKVTVLGWVGYQGLMKEVADLPLLASLPISESVARVAELVSGVLTRIVMALIVLAAIDFWYQRWNLANQLKMTKHEIKEEHKQTEGDPQLKGRIRQKQREMARRRMMQDVARADVVVTNPTHLAIALKYEAGKNQAPEVLAKGADYVAQRIKEIAREHEIPLVENRPLAQALYKTAEIGQEVPQDLYQAVAEVLAYVYKLRGLA